MVASPADRVIARAFGGVVMASDTASGAVSYDDHGVRFVFVPPAQDGAAYALDVECRSTPVPASLAAHFGLSDTAFFESWTRLEVIAKLTEVPIFQLVKEGLADHMAVKAIEILRADTPTHWIAIGKCPNPGYRI